jgi:hypothetical protein
MGFYEMTLSLPIVPDLENAYFTDGYLQRRPRCCTTETGDAPRGTPQKNPQKRQCSGATDLIFFLAEKRLTYGYLERIF